MDFKLVSKFKPAGDQPSAIKELISAIKGGKNHQVLLGATGTGKTFTMANVIQEIKKPTLIISHNKTLAAQLYEEFKEFFPENAVHFFVSYYDYYQPEAYVARSDTYIEKDASINEEIDRLRHAATASILSRDDVIIISSVSCIYGIGEPTEYLGQSFDLKVGQQIRREELLKRLVSIQYDRNDTDFSRGKVRVRGDIIDIYPVAEEEGRRLEFFGDEITDIKLFDPLTGEIIQKLPSLTIFPAKHFATSRETLLKAIPKIQADLDKRYKELKRLGKIVEAERLRQRTNYDIEMMLETGYCSGIENYSLYLSNRKVGDPPFTLIDYFKYTKDGSNNKDFLMIIDESHITIPQIGGMYNGDRARKETLVDFGFRLPTALDNRPLRFPEFEAREDFVIYTSATPGDYELALSADHSGLTTKEFYKLREKGIKVPGVTEQIIRPTGLTDPAITIKPTENQIDDLIAEIQERVKKKQRVLVTTLTKRMAEDLSEYLKELGIKVQYLHSDIVTLERPIILRDLRLGVYDVVIGINLLREGLDIPEVSLVAILDADKEGFLRSDRSLIQTMGRAARHVEGSVIMYADRITGSMERAIEETERRREIQERYNEKHDITPKTIEKAIREGMKDSAEAERKGVKEINVEDVPKEELTRVIKELEKKMQFASENLEFEKAAAYRDQIQEIREEQNKRKF